MRARVLSLLVLVMGGCSRRAEEGAPLLAEARRRLAARDGRLTSYVLEGTAQEAGQRLSFRFAWRSPQWMLGVLGAPVSRAVAWNGEHLYEQSDAEKRFTTYRNELSPEKRAGFLTATFAPFTPEGFRAPLLPSAGVQARRTSHARAPEAVELTVRPEGEGSGVEVAYVLRWPAMDFLGKRLVAPGTSTEVRVEEEQCDEGLGLCVPRKLTFWTDNQQVNETVLGRVELNPTLPADTFTLTAPPGYEALTRTLVDAPAAEPAAPTPPSP